MWDKSQSLHRRGRVFMVDSGGLVFLGLTVLAIPFVVRDTLSRTGRERTVAMIATGAIIALVALLAAKALGWVNDAPFFQAARLSLTALFLLLYFQIMRFGKRYG